MKQIRAFLLGSLSKQKLDKENKLVNKQMKALQGRLDYSKSHAGVEATLPSKGRALWLMPCPKFQTWLTSGKPKYSLWTLTRLLVLWHELRGCPWSVTVVGNLTASQAVRVDRTWGAGRVDSQSVMLMRGVYYPLLRAFNLHTHR